MFLVYLSYVFRLFLPPCIMLHCEKCLPLLKLKHPLLLLFYPSSVFLCSTMHLWPPSLWFFFWKLIIYQKHHPHRNYAPLPSSVSILVPKTAEICPPFDVNMLYFNANVSPKPALIHMTMYPMLPRYIPLGSHILYWNNYDDLNGH